MATSKDFIKRVAENMGVTQKTAKEFANGFELTLKEMISQAEVDDEFRCLDIRFVKKEVPARECKNPATGEKISVPASKKVTIKPSADIKRVAKA